MTFNIRQLDTLDYDDAEPILDDYINGAIAQFAESPEGNAYLEQHNDVGHWIGTFIHFGYVYEGFTLPKMTKRDVKVLMEDILPRKLTLLDPSEADDAIPELTTFWQFLKREYSLRNASTIIKYLGTLEHQFRHIMSDPARGGFAKQFILRGQEAGFDMTTEEGIKAFQEEYNQTIRTSSTPMLSDSPGLLGNMPVNPSAHPNSPQTQFQTFLNLLSGAMASEPFSAEGSSPINELSNLMREITRGAIASNMEPLSPKAIECLTQQHITETEPGTILRDFQTLLDFIKDGIPISGKHNLLPLASLTGLNERLSEPIQTALKRPVQKSYPAIHGLYLLLRASGLGQITTRNNKLLVVPDPALIQSWNSLNPTERYFMLLETWLIRSNVEILGERSTPMTEGSKCLQFWQRLPDKTKKIASYREQQEFNYWPEFHNLALMKLFGFIHLEAGQPEPGKGWRIKTIKRLPFGNALMEAIRIAFLERDLLFESEDNPMAPFGELQADLQPYFPEWQNNLISPQPPATTSGVYIFKVSLNKIWRRIAISSEMTLADLSSLILESVGFDADHLDMFTYKNQLGRTVEISHPYADGSPSTNEVTIGELAIAPGQSMSYVFDFGDWWEFTVQLEEIQSNDGRTHCREILERKGKSPQQYPNEDWDE